MRRIVSRSSPFQVRLGFVQVVSIEGPRKVMEPSRTYDAASSNSNRIVLVVDTKSGWVPVLLTPIAVMQLLGWLVR